MTLTLKIERKIPMTRSIRTALPLVVLALISAALAQSDAQKAFATMKSMPGTWVGKTAKGDPVQVNFKVTAAGTAVMSEIMGHGDDMISMFHLDGPDRLLMTHYCGAGNQPRMQASVSPDGKTITFTFFDGTNLAEPSPGHMQRMILTLLDDNHHTEEWIFAGHGQEMKEFFDLRRQS